MRKSMVRIGLALVIGAGVGLGAAGAADSGGEPWRFTSWRPALDAPVFEGTGAETWDRKIRERGFILLEDGRYTLWYSGYDRDRPETISLGRATSNDGKVWRRDPGNPIFKNSWVEDVCVVRVEGTYQMFAEGRGDVIHRLSSPDGVHWTDHGSIDVRRTDGFHISPGSFGTPTVWHEDGLWSLLYERRDQGIWLATSRDLKVWTNVQDEPVLACGPEPFDRAAVAVNQIVRRDGFYYLFYHALADLDVRDWTTNLARSRDLVHWEKYDGNPIIGDNRSSAVLVPTPQGDRLYTMHPDVRLFEPADR